MAETEVTTLSSKGQVVIPRLLRQELQLQAKDEFLIYGEADTLILKKIAMPPLKARFSTLSRKLGRKMLETGVTRKTLKEAIRKTRDA